LLHGEADGFPGLMVDIYDTILITKLYSPIWFPYLNWIIKDLIEISSAKTVILRLSRLLIKEKQLYGI
jgi:23S rRNA (cytosine1962-C5)-methyltransferase